MDIYMSMDRTIKNRLEERVLRRLLREAGGDIDLGDVEFSQHRTDGVPTDEPDTPEEKALYGELMSWVGSSNIWEGEKTTKLLQRLLLHPKYKGFFTRPRAGSTLYRGISSVPIDKVRGWLRAGGEAEALAAFDGGPAAGETPTRLIVTPGDKGMASWTYSEWTARKKFAETKSDPGSDKCDLVFAASADDNTGSFLDLSRIQAAVPDLRYAGEDESEVLALRHVQLSSLRWRKSKWRSRAEEDEERMRRWQSR